MDPVPQEWATSHYRVWGCSKVFHKIVSAWYSAVRSGDFPGGVLHAIYTVDWINSGLRFVLFVLRRYSRPARIPERNLMVLNLIVAFITGLTAGGIGCVVVQSGLLAGSLALHFERDDRSAGRRNPSALGAATRPRFALTIALFLFAKLIAYTFLGFLLGAFGSFLQLTPPVPRRPDDRDRHIPRR